MHGLRADRRGYGAQGRRSTLREVLGRVKAVTETVAGRDVLLGPDVPMSGDARASWGPKAPAGTPAAGAPGLRPGS